MEQKAGGRAPRPRAALAATDRVMPAPHTATSSGSSTLPPPATARLLLFSTREAAVKGTLVTRARWERLRKATAVVGPAAVSPLSTGAPGLSPPPSTAYTP